VTRFYDIDDANQTLTELEAILRLLADQREELVRLRDQATENAPQTPDGEPAGDGLTEEERRLLRLRMQGLIDQMAAGVARIDRLGITLRDIPTGLVDFPALVAGRPVWLCWRRGEDAVGYWHELDSGFGGRRPLGELV
jgi:hypothetical protein